MTIADKLQIFDHIDEKYVVEATPKRFLKVGAAKAVKPAKRERRPHTVLEPLATVAVILLVFGGIFIWTLVGKDLLNQNKGDDTTPDTTTVPDGEGRYGYIDFGPGKYFVFVKYEDSTVESVDFYRFDENTHYLGIEFKYDSNRKITSAKHYYYDAGYKEYQTGKTIVKYGKDGKFEKLHLYDLSGNHRIGFEARVDGKINMMLLGDLECVLKLNENFLATERTTDINRKEPKEPNVECTYDEFSRITRVIENDGSQSTNWEFVYNEGTYVYSELICLTSDLFSYTITRDEGNNIVYSKYNDGEHVHEYSFRYTHDGIQLRTKQSVIQGEQGKRANHVDYEYDENDKLRKMTAKFLGVISGDNIENTVETTIYGENGIILYEKRETEYVNDGKIIRIRVFSIDYNDEKREESKTVEENKFFDEDGKLNRHEGRVYFEKNGKLEKEISLEYLSEKLVQIDDKEELCITQNEYNENYQLVKSANSYYVVEGGITQRVTLEYSQGEDQRLIRKTTEAFDDNGNLINTNVENYE